jgi:RNA polymerase sigma factor (sigma-70 family)
MHRADQPPPDAQRAFSDWAATQVGALVRFGFALTHDEGAAEDLVEIALARTLLEWPGFAVRGNPDHFARRVIVSELDSVRRRRRRPEATVAHIDLTTTEFAADEAELAERDRIWREIVNVAPRPRAVLVLRFYEGRSEPEVAELLGSSVESVRADAAEGMATLRAGELLDALVSR